MEDLLDTYGRIRYSKGLIILDPNQTDAHKRITLLHEVMHGCWHLGDRSHKNDEKAIRSLCAPLLDVLRRNPDLVAYLLATEDESGAPSAATGRTERLDEQCELITEAPRSVLGFLNGCPVFVYSAAIWCDPDFLPVHPFAQG